MTQRTATLWVADGMINLRSSYCQEFVEDLKHAIPCDKRIWRPKPDQYWQVDPGFADVLEEILKRYRYEINYVEPQMSGTYEAACVELIGLATKEVLSKFRKALMQHYHPDRGGDPAKASRINELFDIIVKDK